MIRTRILLVDISTWRASARVHSEVCGEIRPACTFVEISRLIDPAWLVETEAYCYVDAPPGAERPAR